MTKPTLLFLAAGMLPVAAQIPAFPGAEGYGGYAKGGRGGDVYHVTNLNASGAGSFVEGISTVPAAGRTIVFDVSGYIRFPSGSDGTRMTSSKVTIAGQTAPGDGVGFYNNFFRISGDDVVIRHLRFRHGKNGSGGDCIDLDSGSLNTILDSLSLQFSTDENISSFGSPPENLTMQWSLNGWGLESHSCGGLWDQNHATSHHSLWSHNHTRNPKARPNGLLEWVNNITFDWDIGFIMGDSNSNASWKANVRGNYFLCPPGNLRSKALEKAGLQSSNGLPNFSLYLDNCLHDNDGDGQLNGTNKGYSIASGSYNTAATPFAATGSVPVTIDAPLLAFKKVLSKAGAQRLDVAYTGDVHDEVDARMVSNVLTQTANHITRESALAGVSNAGFGTLNSKSAAVDTDADGMPDFYETALGWTPGVQDHNTVLANSGGLVTGTTFLPTGTVAGYNRLEEYLHFLAIPHGTLPKNIAGTPSSIQVDLRKFTKGFVKSPVFTLTNFVNGTTTQSGTGNYLVTFTPTVNYVGRAKFDFTVTDSDGSAWTQTCALLVSASGLPRDLSWKGDGTANVWDDVSSNWLRNGAATVFSFGDRVTFDDSGSKTPAVNVTGTVSPTTVDVNATGNYTLGGIGAVTSTGALTKRGSGTLTINNTGVNSFGSATLAEGTITLGIEAANNTGLGTGPLTMNSGTLNMYNTGPGGSFTGTLPNPLVINGNVAFNAAARCGTSGALSGAGTLNLYVPYIRTDWGGNPALFSGTLNVTTDGDGCEFRINNGGTGAVTDYGNARLRLADKVNAYFLPNPPSGGDKTQTVQIGELSTTGTGAGVFLGGASGAGDRFVNWKVGALNTSTTFGGVIQNRTGPAMLTKVGSGTLTLTGASTHTGATTLSEGALLVDGSLGNTAVGAAAGTLLGGDGTIGGSVTAAAGAFVSPGTAPFTGATMNLNGGLTLNGNTLYFDMSNTPAGANDRIVMGGGALNLTGTQNFQFLLLQNTLAAGTYDLITGASTISASGYTLSHNLPAGTRQTFTLSVVGTTLRLTVVGDPATLTWTGATSANWDTTTANNWTGAAPNIFGSNDAVVFDDTSGNRSVTLVGTIAPRSIAMNTTAGYNFAGAGIVGGGTLTKTGAGALTLANTGVSTYGGGTFLNGGSIVLADSTANASGLGTGPVTFNGGTLTMAGFTGSNANEFSPMPNALVVPAAATGTLNLTQRAPKPGSASVFPAINGSLSGGGTLNLAIKFIRGDVLGDWSAFTGVLNVVSADGDGGDFRFGTSYYWPGMPLATVNLGTNMGAYYIGTSNSGAGTTVEFGELSGVASSKLLGGTTSGRNFYYRIGGKTPLAGEVVFAGTIGEQSSGVTTSYTKTGAGTWTLSGSGSWNGGTTVEQGTLKISGSVTCLSATEVQAGATLQLSGGSLATEALKITEGASLSAYGNLAGDLSADGTMSGSGFSTGTPGTLAITGNAFFDSTALTRLRGGISSDLITVTGDLSLGGTVQVALAPGTTFGRYPLITYGGALTAGTVTLTGIPGGTTAQLSTSVAGRLDLVIGDSDEDGLPDSWETAYFGNLAKGPNDDPDGDGQNNAMEYLAGTLPNSGASRFAATIAPAAPGQFTISWPSVPGKTYDIETNATLAGTWSQLLSVPAAVSPASTTSYTVTPGGNGMFYRVALRP